jgi:hypothetical protein
VRKQVQGARVVTFVASLAAVVVLVIVWGRLNVRGVDYDLEGGAVANIVNPIPSARRDVPPAPPASDTAATSPVSPPAAGTTSAPNPTATITMPTIEDVRPAPPSATLPTLTRSAAATSAAPPAPPRVAARQPDVAPSPPPAPAPRPQAAPRPVVAPVAPSPPPLPSKPAAATGNATRDAQRALDRGDTGKAVDLARQATSADPSNAEAWLTLGAAYEATGRASLARAAYQSCAAHGKGERVGECRALAQ